MLHKNLNKYRIYTDGAYSSARNQGGIGAVFVKEIDGKLIKIAEVSKGYINTTNNRMELKAIIAAFKCINSYMDDVTIISDSMYAIGASRIGKLQYKRNTNLDVLQELDRIVSEKRSLIGNLHIEWVKGHYEDEFNARADKIAVDASQQLIIK